MASTPSINLDEIVEATKRAISLCYGVRGVCKSKDIISQDISKKGKKEAIFVRKSVTSSNNISVDIHLILDGQVKITETLKEAQKVIKYNLQKAFQGKVFEVNAFAEKLTSM